MYFNILYFFHGLIFLLKQAFQKCFQCFTGSTLTTDALREFDGAEQLFSFQQMLQKIPGGRAYHYRLLKALPNLLPTASNSCSRVLIIITWYHLPHLKGHSLLQSCARRTIYCTFFKRHVGNVADSLVFTSAPKKSCVSSSGLEKYDQGCWHISCHYLSTPLTDKAIILNIWHKKFHIMVHE